MALDFSTSEKPEKNTVNTFMIQYTLWEKITFIYMARDDCLSGNISI